MACDRPGHGRPRRFSGAGAARRVGEASVWYLASERAAGEITRALPHARIIVQLRDPVEVMSSLHGRRVLHGQEELGDFQSALAADVNRAAGRRPRPSPLPLYRDAVRFSEQVARPSLSPDLRRRLQEELRDEVERLGALLGRDLREWSRR